MHSTLQARPGTRALLRVLRQVEDRCGLFVPPGGDFVHVDFTPANLLADGGAITGVIDINPPVLAGDRAFDLATPLFYLYDHDDTRARLLKLAGPMAARALSRPHGAAATRLIAAPPSRSRCHAPPQRLAKLIAADLGYWPER